MQRILQFIIDFLSKFLEQEPDDRTEHKLLVEFTEYVKSLPAFSVYWCRDDDNTFIKTKDGDMSVALEKSKISKRKVWRLTSKVAPDSEYHNEFATNKANDDLMFSAMDAIGITTANAVLDKMKIKAPDESAEENH